MTRVIEYGEPCRGNTGQWGRTVVYEVDGPLGPTPMVDWERLPEPELMVDLDAECATCGHPRGHHGPWPFEEDRSMRCHCCQLDAKQGFVECACTEFVSVGFGRQPCQKENHARW